MREIHFRGKRKDGQGWIYGAYAEFRNVANEVYAAIIPEEEGENNISGLKSVDPETVGQYTGLKDKNGKRIFEGDIVRLIEGCPSCHDTEIVKFEDGGFAPFSIAGWECTPKWEECEVIGTIHDNLELLEGKNEKI